MVGIKQRQHGDVPLQDMYTCFRDLHAELAADDWCVVLRQRTSDMLFTKQVFCCGN